MAASAFSVATPRGPVAGTESGTGPVLVLLAGLGATARLWGDLPPLLGRGFTVVTLDNRGVGGSRAGVPFTLEGAAADVVAVLDAHAVNRVALVGASMGGLIALATALHAPDRVRRLVVASTSGRLSAHGRRGLELFRDMLRHLPPERIGPALMGLAFAPPFQERYPGFVTTASGLYGIDPLDVPGAIAQADHLLAGWDLLPDLASLAIPTLLLAGDRDPLIAAEDTAELAAVLPRATLIRIPEAGHSVLAEGGAQLLDRVIRFLDPGAG